METDSFFCQLLKQLPETFFELLGLPAQEAKAYRFDSVELKKSLRIDGLFVPRHSRLPLYFVEVQFQRIQTFYANLFAKVFCFLEENDPNQEWVAVAIFPSRSEEPRRTDPYDDLINSRRMRRVYLDELSLPSDPSPGLSLVQLVVAPEGETPRIARRLFELAQSLSDSGETSKVVQLVEEILMRRFTELGREEVRAMFKLHDIRKSKVWQEAKEEGREEGREEGMTIQQRTTVRKLLDKGKSMKEIAELIDLPLPTVRRLAKKPSNS